MTLEQLKNRMSRAAGAGASATRRRSAYAFGDLLLAVETVATDAAAPERTRGKAERFLDVLATKADEQGDQFAHPTWLLNGVGEAMALSDYRSRPVLDFLKTELYFYGLDWIERRHRAQSMEFMVAHAEMLDAYFGRVAIAETVRDGTARIAEGRPFCIVHHYVNALRKRFWADRRQSVDACDVAVPLIHDQGAVKAATAPAAAIVEAEAPDGPESRVHVLLEIFDRELTPLQQRVYLARHPIGAEQVAIAPAHLVELCVDADETEGGKETWKRLAARFDTTEKSIKREYLRSLHVLLSRASSRLCGDRPSSGFVRRMLETLRSIVDERDLRIRDNAGRGLGRIVERWEIALRFVLNEGRVAAAGGDASSLDARRARD